MKNFITLAILSFAISIFANGSIPSPPYTLYTLVSLDDYVLLEDPENPGTFVKDSDLGYNVGVSIYFYHTENGPDEDEPGDMTLLLGPLFGSGCAHLDYTSWLAMGINQFVEGYELKLLLQGRP
jgi:hypothetical protein